MQLVEGTVQAEEPNCLRPEERDAGWVLTCVSRPASKCRVKVPS